MSTATSQAQRATTLHRRLVATLLVVVLTSIAAPAYGADGEIIGRGSNEFGNITVSSGKLRANFDNVGDCPAGTSSCRVEVRWHIDNLNDWGTGFGTTGWIHVPAGQDYMTYCPGDSRFRAKLETRLRWAASTTKTVEWWGEYEQVLNIAGDFVYRLLAKFGFNVTNNAGLRVGTKIETTTATYDYSPPQIAAESGGSVLTTNC